MTPDEIVNHPLKTGVRGYNIGQVDELLDLVADEVEHLQGEVATLRQAVAAAELRVNEASETETTLKRTLITAQRAAEQSIEEARERAASILDEARRDAADVVHDAEMQSEQHRVTAAQAARTDEIQLRDRRRDLERHIEALRVFEQEYRARLRRHIESQLQLFNTVESHGLGASPELVRSILRGEDPAPVDDDPAPAPSESIVLTGVAARDASMLDPDDPALLAALDDPSLAESLARLQAGREVSDPRRLTSAMGTSASGSDSL